jgi:hypothetical protein
MLMIVQLVKAANEEPLSRSRPSGRELCLLANLADFDSHTPQSRRWNGGLGVEESRGQIGNCMATESIDDFILKIYNNFLKEMAG